MGLHQTGRIVLAALALLVAALAVAGLATAAASHSGVGHVVGLSLSTPHSLFLLVTAVASGLAALWSRIGRFWAMAQAVLYILAYVIGTAVSVGHPQGTWLRLNAPDHFLHLSVALVSGVLSLTLFWSTAPGTDSPTRILPGEPAPTEQRPPVGAEEESEETRDMIAAEVAVTEGHATPEQARRVQEDAQRRADAEHRRAWKRYES